MRAISIFIFILMVNSAIAAPSKDPYRQLDDLLAVLPADVSQRSASYQAIDALAQSQSKDPAFQAKVAELIAKNDPRRAMTYANNAVTLAPSQGNFRLLRANLNYSLGNFSDAVSDAQEILRNEPGNMAAVSIVKLSREKASRAASNVTATPQPLRTVNFPATAAMNSTFEQKSPPKRSPFTVDRPIRAPMSESLPEASRSIPGRLIALWSRAKERALERVDSQFDLTPQERPIAAKGAIGGMVVTAGIGALIYGSVGAIACSPLSVFAGVAGHASCTVVVGAGGALAMSPIGAYAGARIMVGSSRKIEQYRKRANSIIPGAFGATDGH